MSKNMVSSGHFPGMARSCRTRTLIVLAALAGCGDSPGAPPPFQLPPLNIPPAVAISSPADGWAIRSGQPLFLRGSALDREDGRVPDTRMLWSSSVDGALGTGPQLVISTLTVNEHSITLSASDSEGASASATIQVTVVPPVPASVNVGIPLIDMASVERYKGFPGQLYEGSNRPPPDHAGEGVRRGGVTRRFPVLLSIGMSNTRRHFDEFLTAVAADGSLNPDLVVVNGAQDGREVQLWTSPGSASYNTAASRLASAGLSENDVGAIWILQSNRAPTVALPEPGADAFRLMTQLGSVVRAAKLRYPNLQQVFISTRIYSCATSGLNPEPFAYESGFAAKWLIQAQIEQIRTGRPDPQVGDLDYRSGVAPWIAWGPYLWADGDNPRGDGLTWEAADLEADCFHATPTATAKVSARLLDFFKSSQFTTTWFLP